MQAHRGGGRSKTAGLRGRSFLTLVDYSTDEILALLDLAHRLKREKKRGRLRRRFRGRSLALLFEKRSTRTRCAFETAFGEEGGHPVFLSTQDIHLGAKESVEDTGRVLGRMFDAIQFRGFKQETAEILARCSGVPVYNGLTDLYHPTQILADLMTCREELGELRGRRLVYLGDGRNNVANSLLVGCARVGMDCVIVAPESLFPDPEHVERCRSLAPGTELLVTSDVERGVGGADAVYTDVWVSMGEEAKARERLELLRAYQVTPRVMEMTGKADAIFLHCLPAVKGNEVTSAVMEGERSRVWDEAENRKHTIKALMLATLGAR